MSRIIQHSESFKERLQIHWLFEKKVTYQKSIDNTSNLWTQWACWGVNLPIIQNDIESSRRKSILYVIGIDVQKFDDWFKCRNKIRPLNEMVTFFEVIFEFFYDKYYADVENKTNIKSELMYLKNIGLHEDAVRSCLKRSNQFVSQNKFGYLFKAISYVYERMISYDDKDQTENGLIGRKKNN